MFQTAKSRLWDLLSRDPWLVAKYTGTALILSLIGKSIMIGAHDGANVPKFYAQFTPTLPMLLINFTVYKYLWDQPDLRLRSQIGKKWSKAYGAEFVIGHGLFTLFAIELGVNYIAVSTATGIAAFMATFALNAWILGKRDQETATA